MSINCAKQARRQKQQAALRYHIQLKSEKNRNLHLGGEVAHSRQRDHRWVGATVAHSGGIALLGVLADQGLLVSFHDVVTVGVRVLGGVRDACV